MSSEDRRFGRQSNPVQENGAGVDADDEFGDFEGFEGAALDSIPAAAGPSPWATFPDLLPVQTSPATTGNDDPSPSQMIRGAESHNHEPWLAVAGSSGQRMPAELLPNVAHDVAHGHFSQSRTINPPDVSLSAYQPSYNSVDQVCGSGHTHGQSGEDGIPDLGGQLASLQLQVDAVMQQKHQLQQHVDQLAREQVQLQQQLEQMAREKAQLQQQLSVSHEESTDLRARVVELQQKLVHLSSDHTSATSSQEIASLLQQLQDAVTSTNSASMEKTSELREMVQGMKVNVEEKISLLENDLSELRNNLEKQHLVEETGKLETVITHAVQNCIKQSLESLSLSVTSSLSEAVRSQMPPSQDGVVHSFQKELQRHMDQTRRLLERERQQNLLSLAQGLQAALKQFSATIEPTVNDHNEESGDEKS